MCPKGRRDNSLISALERLDHLREQLDHALDAQDSKQAERLAKDIQELAKFIDERFGKTVRIQRPRSLT